MTPQAVHRKLYGTLPDEKLQDFYASGYRGFGRSGPLKPDEIRAAFTLAITDGLQGPVVLVLPRAIEATIMQEIEATARQIFRRFRGLPGPVRTISHAIKRIVVANRYLADEPARWVAIGFKIQDPIPYWLCERLQPPEDGE